MAAAATAAPAAKKKVRLKVRALRTGFYNNQRYRLGDVFILEDADVEFADVWMERVAGGVPLRVTTGQAELNSEHDRTSAAARAAAEGGDPDDVI